MKFHCPSCSQSLEADKELYGQDINCPSCHRKITIPHFDGRNRKECPYCSEIVLSDAKKCKHCGEYIDAIYKDFASNKNNKITAQKGKCKTAAGLLAIFLGFIGIHKFYLNRPFQGLMYFIFCWTYIPMIISFFEGIYYLLVSEEKFNLDYNTDLLKDDNNVNGYPWLLFIFLLFATLILFYLY